MENLDVKNIRAGAVVFRLVPCVNKEVKVRDFMEEDACLIVKKGQIPF